MKKCLSVVLALLLLCAAAFAEGAQGSVVETFGDLFTIARPETLEPIELTEDDAAESMVYAASSDELEVYAWAIDMEDMTKDELYDFYREDEWLTDVVIEEIGGVEILHYAIEDEGLGMTIVGSNGLYYEFVFYCNTEDAIAVADGVIRSIAKV